MNPIAGMGGRVGLKGTDGLVEEAIRRGAKPVAPGIAARFIQALKRLIGSREIFFLTPSGAMGEDYLRGFFNYQVIYEAPSNTSRNDTLKAVESMLEKAELIIFVGGDGTARDVAEVVDQLKPMIGIPSGVKMFSGCFTINPETGAKLLIHYIDGDAKETYAEVLDVDEEEYRRGRLSIKLYNVVKTVTLPGYVQGSKAITPVDDIEEELYSIAKHVIEEMEDNVVYITGPGYTVKTIHRELGEPYTLLGFDALVNKKVLALDLDEKKIIELIRRYGSLKIILSPVGGSGFILGRGTQVISPEVIRSIDVSRDLIVVSPRWKLMGIDCLYVDTGDPSLDRSLPRYIRVVTGYREYRVVPICINIY